MPPARAPASKRRRSADTRAENGAGPRRAWHPREVPSFICGSAWESLAEVVDQFDGDAVAAQTDVLQQGGDLLAGHDRGQSVVVAGADLREDRPVVAPEHRLEEKPGAGRALAHGLGLPGLAQFDVQEVVAHLRFLKSLRVLPEVLVQEPHVTVVGVACAGAFVVQAEKPGVALHRGIRMRGILNRIGVLAGRARAHKARTVRFVLAGCL